MSIPFDLAEAQAFLTALGLDPAAIRVRAFAHSKTEPEHKQLLIDQLKAQIGSAIWQGLDVQRIAAAQQLGLGVYVNVNPGGATADSILHCVTYVAEFDDGTKEEQWHRVFGSGLPFPSIIVDSGGKSLQCYWVLQQPEPDKTKWKQEQKRLAHFLNSDKSINDASRVMRLPGALYFDSQQQATGKASIVYLNLEQPRVDQSLFLSRLPELPPEPVRPIAPPVERTTPTSRLEATALRVLERVPPREPGTNTRDAYLRLLWSLGSIIGPERAAAAFSRHSPAWAAAEDLTRRSAESQHKLKAGTFFRLVRQEWSIQANQPRQLQPLSRGNVDPGSPPLHPPEPGPAGPATHQDPWGESLSEGSNLPGGDLSAQAMDHCRLVLDREIKAGLSGSALQTRIIELATEYETSPYDLVRIAKEIETEQETELQAESELLNIYTVAQQRKLRKLFTLEMLLPAECVEPLRYLSSNLQTDDLSTAITFLTAASGTLKAGTRVWGDTIGFAERPQLWLAIISRSGDGKSPVMRLGINATRLVTQRYNQLNQDRLAAWEIANAQLARADRTARPRPYAFQLASFTGSALARTLANNEEERLGVLIAVDELAGMFKGLDQFKGGGKGDEQEQLLSMFDNNGFQQVRVGTAGNPDNYVAYEQAHVSIVGGIQPAVFNTLAVKGDPNGMFARLLMVPLPNDYRGDRLPHDYSPERSDQHRQSLENTVLRLSNLPPMAMRLAPDAQVLFDEIKRDTFFLRQKVTVDSHAAIYGKRCGYILRLCGIMHMLNLACGTTAPTQVISKQLVETAYNLIDHIQGYSIHAQNEARVAAGGGIDDMIRRLIEYAKLQPNGEAGPGRFRADRLSPNQRKAYPVSAVKGYIDKMVELGIAQWCEVTARNGGRNYRIISDPTETVSE